MNRIDLEKKSIDELSGKEISFIHLYLGYSPVIIRGAILRSTLSILYQNIQNSLPRVYSNSLMPYLSLCAILDQIGECYDRKDRPEPKFGNGIKRCLVNFSELDEDDDTINIIYALRNSLIHNVSLTFHPKYRGDSLLFGFNDGIEEVFKYSEMKWDGTYQVLDNNREKYTTWVNVKKLKLLVDKCIQTADDLNEQSLLKIRLKEGAKQLLYDYIRCL